MFTLSGTLLLKSNNKMQKDEAKNQKNISFYKSDNQIKSNFI